MSDPILELAGIRKTFLSGFRRRKVAVLRHVDLTVGQGEIFALLGRNGAGKTTLMKILLGLVKPTGGTGALLGRPLGDRQARAQIGFQPEQPYLYPALTVRETLDLMAGLYGLRGSVLIEQVMAQCALAPYADVRVRKLSRGWLQRLTLASALLPQPQLLMLDEPLGGLDPEARMAVKQIIRDLKAAGATIMINSHILPDIEALADRVALLRAGRIVVSGHLADLLGQQACGAEIEIGTARPLIPPQGCTEVWSRPEEGRALWHLSPEAAEDLEKILSDLLRAGARIHAVRQCQPGLEEFFAQEMRAQAA